MKFRFALQTDIPKLVAIEKRQPRCAGWGENGWQAELNQPAACIWCAEENARLMGFVALRLAAGMCEILNVGVSPEFVRRGVGTALLMQALAWVRTHGGQRVTLEVGAGNTAAVALYRKAGLTEIGRRKNFYSSGEDALLMGCDL